MKKILFPKFVETTLKNQCDLLGDRLPMPILESMRCSHKRYNRVVDLERPSGLNIIDTDSELSLQI